RIALKRPVEITTVCTQESIAVALSGLISGVARADIPLQHSGCRIKSAKRTGWNVSGFINRAGWNRCHASGGNLLRAGRLVLPRGGLDIQGSPGFGHKQRPIGAYRGVIPGEGRPTDRVGADIGELVAGV